MPIVKGNLGASKASYLEDDSIPYRLWFDKLSIGPEDEHTVIIEGWDEGFNKVKATKLLQEVSGYTLAEAKKAIDDVLNNKDIFVYFESRDSACDFQEKIEEIGANAQVID